MSHFIDRFRFPRHDCFLTRGTNSQRDTVIRKFDHDAIIEIIHFVDRKYFCLNSSVAVTAIDNDMILFGYS